MIIYSIAFISISFLILAIAIAFIFRAPVIGGAYTVKYKQPKQIYWRTLKNVKGDGIVFTQFNEAVPLRYFVLADDGRIELPMNLMFRFDDNRCRIIEESIRRNQG
jgi:hypothetical protein